MSGQFKMALCTAHSKCDWCACRIKARKSPPTEIFSLVFGHSSFIFDSAECRAKMHEYLTRKDDV